MTTNIIDLLQQALNSKPLQKVNPNTQDIEVKAADTSNASKLQQAVISAVLTGIYKITRTHEGAEQALRGNISTSWGSLLFADNKSVIITRIAEYAFNSPASVSAEIEMAGIEAADIIRTNAGGAKSATVNDVTDYLKDQRNNILHYLPAVLQLGALLDDDTLDDHTHKMDGPISGLMHSIEKAFSGTPPAEEAK